MSFQAIPRRHLLALGAAAPLLGLAGCGTPLPLTARVGASQPDAERMLLESAREHGHAAYRRLKDINVRYDGQWRNLIDRIQPVVVDKGFRGWSEERIVPAAGVVAQSYRGPSGTKHGWWRRGDGSAARPGEVKVWRNGRVDEEAPSRSAAALVAEGYGLFLLGPLWLVDRGLVARRGGRDHVDGRPCEIVDVWMQPGLGQVALDRVSVYIDSANGIARRVRFTLEGFASTRGAVAEVDTFDHERHFGVLWPMRSYEEVVHPLRVPAHDWHITGLDVDRGYAPSALEGPAFSGAAAAPAAAVARARG